VAEPWNINIHYDATIDRCVPQDAGSVLDVGCGDGFLAARLARRLPRVVAVDVDGPVLQRARARFPDAAVEWVHADVHTMAGRFDAVVSNAALHHLPDTRVALRRLRSLVAPGGTLAVVTFARPGWRHLPWAVRSFVATGVATRVRGKWEHSAPIVWPPRDSVSTLRGHVAAELPGATMRLLMMGRVLIHWRAPRVRR
jgi:2-polyprenyl-3-methyl-5-hydroxy-6-metoxy-1,4-benzoquinol methylase